MATQKWRKKELLMEYGLSTPEEIQAQTKIYRKSETSVLFSDLLRMFDSQRQRYVYIIKLVPVELRPKLKNYLLQDKKELFLLKKMLASDYSYEEIWCCKNPLDETNIYGRYFLGDGIHTDYKHTIEIVLGNTARLIEKVTMNNSIPYIQAERTGWGRSYIVKNNCQHQYSPEMKVQLLSSACFIEKKREKIEFFAESLFKVGIYSLCLEFVIQNHQMILIDWDTEDDRKALNRLL